jgi:hypothetical protein
MPSYALAIATSPRRTAMKNQECRIFQEAQLLVLDSMKVFAIGLARAILGLGLAIAASWTTTIDICGIGVTSRPNQTSLEPDPGTYVGLIIKIMGTTTLPPVLEHRPGTPAAEMEP